MTLRKASRRVSVIHRAIEFLEPRRLFSAGQLDPTFGVGGEVTESYNGTTCTTNAIAIDTQNLIYAVGTEHGSGGDQFDAMRFFPDGSLDTSFGNSGKVDGGGDTQQGTACAVDSRGLVIAGATANGAGGSEDFFITRLGSNGFYDRSFNGNGLAYVDFTPAGSSVFTTDRATGVAIDNSGNYVVAGFSGVNSNQIAVARFDTNGHLLNKFTASLGGSDFVLGMGTDNENRIVVVGTKVVGTSSVGFVARFLPNGSFDTSFNLTGVQYLNGPGQSATAVKVSGENDSITVAGNVGIDGFVTQMDTFGDVTNSRIFSLGSKVYVSAVDVRPDGKVMTAGSGPSGEFTAEQFNSNLSIDTHFGTNPGSGRSAVASFGSGSYANAAVYNGDGQIIMAGEEAGQFTALARLQTAETPYSGFDATPDQTIQAENFDYGGEGTAYHDNTALNYGDARTVFNYDTAYRNTGVDIYSANGGPVSVTGPGSETVVGFIQAGEWLNYTVSIPKSGLYSFSAFGGALNAGALLDVSFDGVDKSGLVAVPVVSQTYTTFGNVLLNLKAGVHVMQVAFSESQSNTVSEIDSFNLTTAFPGSISGTVYNDVNGDGFIETGDNGLGGRQVYLDTNKDGILDNGEKAVSTDSSGNYKFSNVPVGTYTVRQVLPSGWTQTYPAASAGQSAGVYSSAAITGVTFEQHLIHGSASVSGTVFNDANDNKKLDKGETGLANWTVYIDADNNGALDTGEVSVTTDASGSFQFTGLAPGTYKIRVVRPTGWTQTSPANNVSHTVTLAASQSVTSQLFGEFFSG